MGRHFAVPQRRRTIDRLTHDLLMTAALTEVDASESTIRRVLNIFSDGFLNASVQFRTTSKPVGRRDLCFRYLDLDTAIHPLDLAHASGELEQRPDDPAHRWLVDARRVFGALGYGADFEATAGLTKIWHFLDRAWHPRRFVDRLEMPPSFAASLPVIEAVGLDAVTIIGVDYPNRSFNIYFRPPGHDVLRGACERLGFPAPSREAEAHAAASGCIAFTYAWGSPRVERICFYTPNFRRDDVPDVHPNLVAFARAAPALVDDPRFILGWSHGPGGHYFTLEDDYTGDVSGIFAAAMGVAEAERTCTALPVQQPDGPELHV